MVVQVKVYGPKQEIKIIDLCETAEQLETLTAKQFREILKTAKYFPKADSMKFVYKDEPLQENTLLVSRGIKHMSVIFMVMELPGGI